MITHTIDAVETITNTLLECEQTLQRANLEEDLRACLTDLTHRQSRPFDGTQDMPLLESSTFRRQKAVGRGDNTIAVQTGALRESLVSVAGTSHLEETTYGESLFGANVEHGQFQRTGTSRTNEERSNCATRSELDGLIDQFTDSAIKKLKVTV